MADQLSVEVEENDGAKRVTVVFTPVESPSIVVDEEYR
jgi:hypothetical protein